MPQDVPLDPDVVERNRKLSAMVVEAKTTILEHAAMGDVLTAEPLKMLTAACRMTEEQRLNSSTRASYIAKECEVALKIHKRYKSANNLFYIDAFSNPANFAAVSLVRVEKLIEFAYSSPFEEIECQITACMGSADSIADKKGSLTLLSPQEDSSSSLLLLLPSRPLSSSLLLLLPSPPPPPGALGPHHRRGEDHEELQP